MRMRPVISVTGRITPVVAQSGPRPHRFPGQPHRWLVQAMARTPDHPAPAELLLDPAPAGPEAERPKPKPRKGTPRERVTKTHSPATVVQSQGHRMLQTARRAVKPGQSRFLEQSVGGCRAAAVEILSPGQICERAARFALDIGETADVAYRLGEFKRYAPAAVGRPRSRPARRRRPAVGSHSRGNSRCRTARSGASRTSP